ncbi:MAG: Dyp-type peroxidase [Gammaproteobacteria bacterium]
MSTPQSAILPEAGNHASFFILDMARTDAAQQAVGQAAAALPGLLQELGRDDPAAGLVGAVAFGAAFWPLLHPAGSPPGLAPFREIRGVKSAPASGGDVFVHVHSNRQDLNYEVLRRFYQPLAEYARVLGEVHGFQYLDSRDLTGFIDGTENPKGEARAAVALIGEEAPEFAGGSHVLAQRYVHRLQAWQRLPVPEQEKIIGRSKPDSIELPEEVKPPTAHISRVVIEEQGEELEIVRHSMPYGEVAGEAGLFFLAYSRERAIFDRMLGRIYGVEGDGLYDHLMDYTEPRSGAYFFAPSLEMLHSLAL